jgi:hypothetical protein
VDLHVPEGPVRSVKDFLIHIGIVTLGILIALGLEQLVEIRNHRAQVAEAIKSFNEELDFDASQIADVIHANEEVKARIKAEIQLLEAGTPHEIADPHFNFDLMEVASWDSAVSTQALSHMPYDTVRRYAQAFDTIRLFSDQERKGLADWQAIRTFGDNAAKLSPDQRGRLVELLRHYETHATLIEKIGDSALKSKDLAMKPAAEK